MYICMYVYMYVRTYVCIYDVCMYVSNDQLYERSLLIVGINLVKYKISEIKYSQNLDPF